MNNVLFSRLKEATISILPVVIIILIVNIFVIAMPFYYIIKFILGTISLIVGMTLFTTGANIALIPMGQKIGSHLIKSKKILLILGVSLLIGIIITVAEPDLLVLATQIGALPNTVFVIIVSVGVGLFLVLAMIRMLYKIKIAYLLMLFYGLILILMMIVPNSFISLAFDAGGVTTGPITVPLILALGVGFTRLRGDKGAKEDSFGIITLCSIGPVLVVLLLGLFIRGGESSYQSYTLTNGSIMLDYVSQLFNNGKSVLLVMLPIVSFFTIFQLIALKIKKSKVIKIIKGLIYTYIGLVLFLAGANMGYLPLGYLMGHMLASLDYYWLIIPIGILVGYSLVVTEPAVQVLTDQIDKITQGNISKRVMMVSLSISVALAVGLSMLRVLVGIPIIYLLWGGYALALILVLIVPNIFTTLAFDSGGVAAGTMTATFLLPFAVGASEALNGNPATDAFGLIALAALAPILTIQMLGLLYKYRVRTVTNNTNIIQDKIIDYQTNEEAI